MKATLALDDDVATLLEQARQAKGRSLEEVGNELLRRTLEHFGASRSWPEPQIETEDPIVQLEADINRLYEEIGGLVGRLAKEPGLQSEIERRRQQLHDLQVKEAAVLRLRAEKRRHLKPGEGAQILKRAERLLDS